MKKVLLMITAVGSMAIAGPVQEQKLRDRVDEAVAKAAADFKDCGKRFKVSFDWRAFDAIDWKKLGKSPRDYLLSEITNLGYLGVGLDQLCADKDYKTALGKLDAIVYRTTFDKAVTLEMKIAGKTMTITNQLESSTRTADYFATVAKKAL